jgi:hypothetical protein
MNSKSINKLANLVASFDKAIAQQLIEVKDNAIHIYPEIWANNPTAFTINAYRYLRLKHKIKENTPIQIKHIENSTILARFENQKVIII